MHVYPQTSTNTILPRKAFGVRGAVFTQRWAFNSGSWLAALTLLLMRAIKLYNNASEILDAAPNMRFGIGVPPTIDVAWISRSADLTLYSTRAHLVTVRSENSHCSIFRARPGRFLPTFFNGEDYKSARHQRAACISTAASLPASSGVLPRCRATM